MRVSYMPGFELPCSLTEVGWERMISTNCCSITSTYHARSKGGSLGTGWLKWGGAWCKGRMVGAQKTSWRACQESPSVDLVRESVVQIPLQRLLLHRFGENLQWTCEGRVSLSAQVQVLQFFLFSVTLFSLGFIFFPPFLLKPGR